ncbi:MAG: PilZ domain-containing protein [Nitrospira sp.]|nr:PilZ domain-containing protein [Nitrospira sp.]
MEPIDVETAKKRRFAQLRRHCRVRLATPFPCLFALVSPNRRLAVEQGDVGVVYDMSAKGARMMTEAVISPGDRIALSLQFPHHTSPTIIEVATVRWGRAQTYGIEFDDRSPIADAGLQMLSGRSARQFPVPVP